MEGSQCEEKAEMSVLRVDDRLRAILTVVEHILQVIVNNRGGIKELR